ncbi:hypothetical protein CPC08DRAFT_814910 [Agrocybe pediades]|nr:hypothetical protein CPC08DRAFT_814910 [Agrocybe pediades]
MSRSPLLASFDPFATHPFTNNSGVIPEPPSPSMYPVAIPSAFSSQTRHPSHPSDMPAYYNFSTSFSTKMSTSPSRTLTSRLSPQPRYHSPSPQSSPSSPSREIFNVPCRKHTSSPDLVLKKKHLGAARYRDA